MIVESKYESTLKLESIIISQCSFFRTQDEISKLRLQFKCNRKIENLDKTGNRHKITLTLIVHDEQDLLNVDVTGVGIFFISNQDDIYLIQKNAIAIMFPYLRSYISTITAQPGLTPIMLPAININALLEDQE